MQNLSFEEGKHDYSGIPIFRTSRGNSNWFENSGVREIEGGIKLRLTGRVLFDCEDVFKFLIKIHPFKCRS